MQVVIPLPDEQAFQIIMGLMALAWTAFQEYRHYRNHKTPFSWRNILSGIQVHQESGDRSSEAQEMRQVATIHVGVKAK